VTIASDIVVLPFVTVPIPLALTRSDDVILDVTAVAHQVEVLGTTSDTYFPSILKIYKVKP